MEVISRLRLTSNDIKSILAKEFGVRKEDITANQYSFDIANVSDEQKKMLEEAVK